MAEHAAVNIVRRRVYIPFEAACAPGWFPSEKEIEDFLNAVSFVFPPGEKFFIRSVQHFQHRITDPVLREQIKDFIYQEAMHSKEHARANAVLAASFLQGPEIEKAAAEGFAWISRVSRPSTQLAFTCAFEHFTAILSHELLKHQEDFISKTDPAFAAMWLWHAVEETEHKAVCFDVYQQVCGKGVFSYLHRVAVMLAATYLFIKALRVSVRMLKEEERNEAVEAKAGSAFRPEPGSTRSRDDGAADENRPPNTFQILREILPLKLYFDFFRLTFHPGDTDDSELIAEWKRRYRDFGISRDGTDAAAGEGTG
jgi:predicted metal-dependent hydrolase